MINMRSRIATQTRPDRPLPSITDWIQTIAVVSGIAVGVWQFVIHDRDAELQRRKAVTDLLIAGQSDGVSKAMGIPFAWRINPPDISPEGIAKIQQDMMPLETYVEAWGLCYSNGLCDKKLSAEASCDYVGVYDGVTKLLYNATKRRVLIEHDPSLTALVNECRQRDDARMKNENN